MKKAVLYMVVLAGIGCFFSCRKEYSLENGNVQLANFTAQVDGVHWQSAVSTEQASILQGLINITGISSDNQEISMTLSGTGTGTYQLSLLSTSLATYANIDSPFVYGYTTNSSSFLNQAGGQVTITEIDQTDQTISGTFAFNAYRVLDGKQKTITQGIFTKLPYTTTLSTNNNNGDTMTATIDAKAWVGKSIQAAITAGNLTIVGVSADGSQSVGLIMPYNTTPGTYPLDGSNLSYIGVYTVLANGNTAGLVSVSGQVTVTQNNTTTKRISGTFTFTASNPANPSQTGNITQGVFSVYYGP
jgi:hypothetical protein